MRLSIEGEARKRLKVTYAIMWEAIPCAVRPRASQAPGAGALMPMPNPEGAVGWPTH